MKKPSPYNPANLLSLLRIIAVPFFVVMFYGRNYTGAFALFVAASLTDLLDGWLARRYGWKTKLGEFIDPLGDKLLTLSAMVLLFLGGIMPFWCMVLAFAREIVVVTGFSLLALLAKRKRLSVSLFGKAGTLFHMTFLSLVLAWLAGILPPAWGPPLRVLLMAAVAFHFVSGLDYAVKGVHEYEKNRRGATA